jgi:hypothetical protein
MHRWQGEILAVRFSSDRETGREGPGPKENSVNLRGNEPGESQQPIVASVLS